MTPSADARYLLMGDDTTVQEWVSGLLRGHGTTELVTSLRATEACLKGTSTAPDGVVVSTFTECPEAGLVALVERVRDAWPSTHVILLTRQPTRALINCAAATGAQVASALPPPAALGPFVSRTTRRAASLAPPATSPLDALVDRCGLSRREHEVLSRFLSGVPQAGLAESLDLAPKTLANHVHRILTKTGHPTLMSLAVEVLVEAHEELDDKTPVTAAYAMFKGPSGTD